MKKLLLAISLASAMCMVGCDGPAQPKEKKELKAEVINGISVPSPLGSINDFEHILTDPDEIDLQKAIDEYRQSSGNEVVIVTMDTIPAGMDATDFASAIGNVWGVGDADQNNGLIILLSESQSQVGIATGKGLETTYNDSVCSDIIGKMIPHLSIGNYTDGFVTAIRQFSKIESH